MAYWRLREQCNKEGSSRSRPIDRPTAAEVLDGRGGGVEQQGSIQQKQQQGQRKVHLWLSDRLL